MSNLIDVRNIHLDELDLSARAYNGLVRAKLFTVGDILSNPKEVINTKHIGQKTLSEIDQILGTDFCKLSQDQNREIDRLNRMKKNLKTIKNMKIELISERELDKGIWYEIRVDGKYITGSSSLETAESMYNQFLKDPSILEKETKVLKSEEI
jgi:hypothetical protein